MFHDDISKTQSVMDESQSSQGSADEITVVIDRILAVLQRQIRVIFVFVVIGLTLGLSYLLSAQPQYTASTQLLIEDRAAASGEFETSLNVGFDTSKIDSQVELIQSERIASTVIDKLDLTNDLVFLTYRTSILQSSIARLRSLLSIGFWTDEQPILTDSEREANRRTALRILSNNLEVNRVGRTYVLNISYTSPSPREAARIANAFGEAYLLDQMDAKYDATRRASDWLQGRIQELREQSLASDLAVQRFRSTNNLLEAEGTLLNEQQLAEMSSQLTAAQAATAQAEARARRIEYILETSQLDAAVTEALNNPVIADLRSKFLDASKRYAEISAKLGANHVQALKFKNEMNEFQRVIFEELARIAESYRSELAIARTREATVRENLAKLKAESAGSNELLVNLRELERESETYRNLYQTFLQRYQETIQQQSFPVTEARIISVASEPDRPSQPKKLLVLALAGIVGGMMGVAVGGIREYRDRGVRTGEQVRDRLGIEYLGLLPDVPHRSIRTSKADKAPQFEGQRVILPADSIMRQTLDAPMSIFAETLRSAKIGADLMLGDGKSKVIGVVSVFPGEGKTTVSKNFASLLASLGARTLLMDCDLRNPGLTKALHPDGAAGLLDVLTDGKEFKDTLLVEPDSKLFFLPAGSKRQSTHTSELIASVQMRRLLREARDAFDYIIVDLPPAGAVVDVRAMMDQIDAIVFVIEWGKTSRQSIRNIFQRDPRLPRKCLGAILNKVDTNVQKLYEHSGVEAYEKDKYSNYYSD